MHEHELLIEFFKRIHWKYLNDSLEYYYKNDVAYLFVVTLRPEGGVYRSYSFRRLEDASKYIMSRIAQWKERNVNAYYHVVPTAYAAYSIIVRNGKETKLKKCSMEEVHPCTCCLWFDFDFHDEYKKSLTKSAEVANQVINIIKEWAKEQGIKGINFVYTGGGVQLFIIIDDFVYISTLKERNLDNAAYMMLCIARHIEQTKPDILQYGHFDTVVFERARILRLPLSYNCKYPFKPRVIPILKDDRKMPYAELKEMFKDMATDSKEVATETPKYQIMQTSIEAKETETWPPCMKYIYYMLKYNWSNECPHMWRFQLTTFLIHIGWSPKQIFEFWYENSPEQKSKEERLPRTQYMNPQSSRGGYQIDYLIKKRYLPPSCRKIIYEEPDAYFCPFVDLDDENLTKFLVNAYPWLSIRLINKILEIRKKNPRVACGLLCKSKIVFHPLHFVKAMKERKNRKTKKSS